MIDDATHKKVLDDLSYKNKMEQCILALLNISNSSDLTEEDIVKIIINEVQELTSSSCGYLHLFDHQSQTIDLKVWSDSTLEHCTAVYEHQYPLSSAGIWADCARTGEPVIHNDYATAPNKKGLPEGHFHITRHLSIPVMEDNECKVIIGVGNKDSDYDENDVRYMSVIAKNLWNLIQTKRYENKLKKLNEEARYDFLTGAYVRKEFERLLYVLTSTSYTSDHHSIGYFDLDNFKIINDTYGHKTGDEVLKYFVDVIRKYVRQSDYICRLGGDEFSVIFRDVRIYNIKNICQKILDDLSTVPFTYHDIQIKIKCSIGLCEFSTDNPEKIMINVDAACYMAKENGKHQIRVFNKEHERYVARELELSILNKLPHLISADSFKLYVQPIKCCQFLNNTCHTCQMYKNEHKNNCFNYEVLLRIYDDHTLFLPKRYFKIAEKYNLMQKIDEWVISTSFDFLNKHTDRISMLFINLSNQSINNYSFFKFLNKELDHLSCPEKICFEITESVTISNFDQVESMIKNLKEKKCKVALDNFGNGFCSFKYLKDLSIDFIKIDGTFIKDLDTNTFSYTIVKAIKEIASHLGIKIIAEEVETEQALQKVLELELDFAQGYYIRRPHSIDNIRSIENPSIFI